jgi:hypothetical protein
MYTNTYTATSAAPVSSGLSGLKAKVLNKVAVTKPKIMARLPMKNKIWKPQAQVQPTSYQSSTVPSTQIAKAKGGIWSIKNKISTNGNRTFLNCVNKIVALMKPKILSHLPGKKQLWKTQNSTLATPGVPVQHSSLFQSNLAPGVVVKPTLFQKAKLALGKVKSSFIHKNVGTTTVQSTY